METIKKFNTHPINQFLNSNKFPVMDGLLILFVSVLGNYVGQTINPSLQKLIEESKHVQYVILFVLLFATISLSFTDSNMEQILISSLGIFMMFYVMSMFNVKKNIIIFAALLAQYSTNKYITYLTNYQQNAKYGKLITYLTFVNYSLNAILIATFALGGSYEILDKTGALQKLCSMI